MKYRSIHLPGTPQAAGRVSRLRWLATLGDLLEMGTPIARLRTGKTPHQVSSPVRG